MKKTILLSFLILTNVAFSQKAKKVSYNFKQEILPIKLLPADIKSFDYAIIANEESKKKEIALGNKITSVFGVAPTTGAERYFKPAHFNLMKNAFNYLKYKDNKSYGIMGATTGTGTMQSYKNVSVFTNEANLSISIEFGDYNLVDKEYKDNSYNLKLNCPGAKLTLINNLTKEKIEERILLKDLVIYNFPFNYNEGSATPLVFQNKLALDNGLNEATNNNTLDDKIRQYVFNCIIKETIDYLNYTYNFNVINTTIYFAYPKNEKLIEYKNSVIEMESIADAITKNSGNLTHLNWNTKEIQDKLKIFTEKMENGLKQYNEKGKELEMSEEIAEGFKLNLATAYCLSNNFENAAKYY